MIKRFAGQALVVAGCLISHAFAEDAAAPAKPAAAATPAPAATAAAVEVNPDHPTSYTVKQGDTLWGIAEKFLKNPWQWPEVWHINEQVANPHLIYPGDVLRLVWNDGKPSLVVDRDVTPAEVAKVGGTTSVAEVMPDGKTVKLHPRMREMPFNSAIPAIPMKSIEAFLTDSRVVSLDELKKAPYVVAGADKRVLMGRGDTLYARDQSGKWADAFPEYGIYRQGAALVDPDTRELLGYEAKKVGSVRVLESNHDIATMRVLTSSEDIRLQDRLLGTDQRPVQSMFYPRPAPDGVEGRVLEIFGSLGFGARNDVIVVNKGQRDKVEPGVVFSVMQNGGQVRDSAKGDLVNLPPVTAAQAIVFRSFDRVSYALIMRSSRTVSKGDLVKPPRLGVTD